MRGQPLQPYDPSEAIGTDEAKQRSGKSERTIREWCVLHCIGRKIAGRWAVSAPALDMLLAGDQQALEAYLSGDRTDRVRDYFARRGINPNREGSAMASADAIDAAAPLN